MMLTLFLLIIVLFVVVIASSEALAQTPFPPRNDSQFWNEVQIVKPLDPKRDLVFIGVLRIGREWTRPVDERAGVGVAFKINKYLTVMPTYIHVEYQPFTGRFIHEERLILNVTGKASLGKFNFTDRNLIERRVRPGTADFTVYRNRLQIDHPMRVGKFAFRVFVADEVWYSTQKDGLKSVGWFRNRIGGGIIKQLSERLHSEFFFLQQHDGFIRPGNVPVFGTLFRCTL